MSADDTVNTIKVRGYMMMAALADHMDERVRNGGPLDLDGIVDRDEAEYVAEIDRRGAEIVLRSVEDDTELTRMVVRAGNGSAWLRSFNGTVAIIRELKQAVPTLEMFEDLLISHTDLTDLVEKPPIVGRMIPTRLLPKMTFAKAVAVSVHSMIDSDLAKAVGHRIDNLAPAHPMGRFLFQMSVFLSMIASSSREAEDAINMASSFLKRFEDEDMIARLAIARDEASESTDMARNWTLQLMCTATFRMKRCTVMIGATEDALSILDMPGGRMSPDAATVSMPLATHVAVHLREEDETPTMH